MKKQFSLFLFLIMFVTLFVSCGKEKEREFGIDGYAYLADLAVKPGEDALDQILAATGGNWDKA